MGRWLYVVAAALVISSFVYADGRGFPRGGGGGAPITGTAIAPLTVQASHVDAGIVQTSQLYFKSSPASGQTIDCRFNANQDSNNLYLQGCPFNTASGSTFAGGSTLIQSNHQMHSGSAVSVVDAAATAPTVATGCTGETMTWAAGSASLRFDVGTSACTGVSTAVITLPGTAANCWTCECWNPGGNKNLKQTACTTTTATITNMGTSVATPADWAVGDDVQCMCRGG